jgi:hypothetical protein
MYCCQFGFKVVDGRCSSIQATTLLQATFLIRKKCSLAKFGWVQRFEMVSLKTKFQT